VGERRFDAVVGGDVAYTCQGHVGLRANGVSDAFSDNAVPVDGDAYGHGCRLLSRAAVEWSSSRVACRVGPARRLYARSAEDGGLIDDPVEGFVRADGIENART